MSPLELHSLEQQYLFSYILINLIQYYRECCRSTPSSACDGYGQTEDVSLTATLQLVSADDERRATSDVSTRESTRTGEKYKWILFIGSLSRRKGSYVVLLLYTRHVSRCGTYSRFIIVIINDMSFLPISSP